MNKFIDPPDPRAGLAGGVLGIGPLAGLVALLFTSLGWIGR
jgi:hypothetical protein